MFKNFRTVFMALAALVVMAAASQGANAQLRARMVLNAADGALVYGHIVERTTGYSGTIVFEDSFGRRISLSSFSNVVVTPTTLEFTSTTVYNLETVDVSFKIDSSTGAISIELTTGSGMSKQTKFVYSGTWLPGSLLVLNPPALP